MTQSESTSNAPSVTALPASALKRRARRLAALAFATCITIVILGWTTGLRDWMHASLIAFGVFALLPFLVFFALLAAFTAFVFACSLMVGSMGADDALPDGFTAHATDSLWGVSGGIRIYYGWLARHRDSAWFGLPLGVLLGGLVLWAALAVVVVPREAKTVARLRAAQVLIEDHYQRLGRYPRPDARGAFLVPSDASDAFADALSAGGQLLDAFGKPVDYLVKGHGRIASYRLRSPGFDAASSGDDLCASGETRLMKAIDLALLAQDLANILKRKDQPWRARFKDIYAASCER